LRRADLVVIGRILRSQGTRGQVKLRLLERELSGITCTKVYLRRADKDEEFEVESLELGRHATFLKLKGIDTLAAADAIAGIEVYIPEACFPPPGSGRYYHFQVVGSRVVTRDGREVGTVAGVMPVGEDSVLVVSRGGRETYVPFAEPILVRVDPSAKEIVIDPPGGLLELNEI
jgi:16S rRNA processing protein RimM